MSRSAVVWWLGFMVAGSAVPAFAAGVSRPTQAQVEQAVIAAIPPWHGQKATILKYLDLTQPFATTTPWALVVAQDPHQRDVDPMGDTDSPIAVCLVRGVRPHCSEFHERVTNLSGEPSWYAKWYAKHFTPDRMFGLGAARIVHVGPAQARPLLLLKTGNARSLDGNTDVRTLLYRYDHREGGFRLVFVNDSAGSNNNQEAHFIEHGPLQGDEIVDFPTEHPPYAYWIEVFAPRTNGPYRRIIRYRSITHYGDRNPLPVADSEMPEIMKRLGVWEVGEAVPIPADAPAGCAPLVLRHGEAWCKSLRIPSPPQQ